MRIQSNSDKWTHHQTSLSLTCTFLESYNLASLFNYPWLMNISGDTLTANKHLLLPKCSEMMMWFYDKLGETLKTYRATLTFLDAVLLTWEQAANSSKCPTVPSLNFRIRQSIIGFLSQNISEDIRNTPFQSRQSFHNPAGIWLARFWIFFLVLCVCATSNLKLNNILTT